MVDSYPFIPDLAAMTDLHGFSVVKFSGNPTDVVDRADPRMEAALIRPLEPSAEVMAEHNAKVAAHRADPENIAPPGLPPMNYEFFLPQDDTTAINLKRKFDVENPNKDSSDLYTNASQPGEQNDSFRYTNIRIYETGLQSDLHEQPYQEVAVALHDTETTNGASQGDDGTNPPRQKAAYYYPIIARQQLKPRRAAYLANLGLAAKDEEEGDRIDVVEVTIRDPDEEEAAKRSALRDELDTKDE